MKVQIRSKAKVYALLILFSYLIPSFWKDSYLLDYNNLCWKLIFLLPSDLTITLQSSNYLFFTIFFISIQFIFANNSVLILLSLHLLPPSHLVSGPFLFPSFDLLSKTLGQVLCLSLLSLNFFHACLHFIRIFVLDTTAKLVFTKFSSSHWFFFFMSMTVILGASETLNAWFPYSCHFPVKKGLGDNKEWKWNKITNIEA